LSETIDLLTKLGLTDAKHWNGVSDTTKVFELPGGTLVYLKGSNIEGRPGFWGVDEEVISALLKARTHWKVILANEAKRTGYVIDDEKFLGQIAKGQVSQGQYKIYEGAPKLKGLSAIPFEMIREAAHQRTGEITRGEWTREDTVLALALYKATGPSHDKEDPEVREVARLTGKSPSSIVLKLGNFKWVESGGKAGLSHATRLDEKIWREFLRREEVLHADAEKIRERTYSKSRRVEEDQIQEDEDLLLKRRVFRTEGVSKARTRLQTEALRRIVLRDYDETCAFCDMNLPQLLEVAHIRGWDEDAENRLNPSNALCLCLLHHGAFDSKLLTVLPDGDILLSKNVATNHRATVEMMLKAIDRKTMRKPHKFAPNPEFLKYHNDKFFESPEAA
jgi:hypothetical protein